MRSNAMLVLTVLVLALPFQTQAEERKESRTVLDFEDGADAELLKKSSEGCDFDIVQDNGVTSGKNCCRWVGTAGAPYASCEIRGEKLKGWEKYDYVALDIFTEREEKINVVFELWDAVSKNYPTRYTDEDKQTHVGKNTILWRINRAGRNSKKDGLEWHEILPQDRIKMEALSKVKIFFCPLKAGGNTVLWIDNLRLLQEDAAVPKLTIALPEGAKAFDFGPKGSLVAGFTAVSAGGAGLGGSGVKDSAKPWPDPLAGDGVESEQGPFRFEVELPDGEYWVWLSAARLFNAKTRKQPFTLKVGDQTLCDETMPDADFYGEKGLFRFLRTQYSQRPNAQWLDYVLPATPEYTVKAKAEGGKLAVQVCNHRLSALVVMPAKEEAAFKKLAETIRNERIRLFYSTIYMDPHAPVKAAEGDGAYALWLPAHTHAIRPWSGPSADERKAKTLDLKAAPGQRLVARVCVTPFEDLGEGDLTISDLAGPGEIPASNIRAYYQNYRVVGTSVDEMALLPWTKIRFEPNTTWAYWIWIKVPGDAKPGNYKGSVTFKPAKGGAKSVPVELEVYPFKLEENLPASFGMYYGPWDFPEGYDRRKLLKEQHVFMREVGFTATCVGLGKINGVANGTVQVDFDPLIFDIAKEVGMGRRPAQYMMANSLGFARHIARRHLGFGAKVDQQPGSELANPELKGLFQNALKQYKEFVEKQGLPVAFESVDEPREVPNPWNRNLKDTNTYGDWIREATGLPCFVTPMSDSNSGLDYTALVDHHDIISIHAWPASKKLIAKTQASNKRLWFYNTGMDRLSWGFYCWRMGATGRWEWHWSWDDGGKADGYPNDNEKYTSFTGCGEKTMRAPYDKFLGGMLCKSEYLNVCEGINDFAYLITLEQALEAAKSDAAKAKTVEEAQAFLAALKKSIPEFPGIKNMASPDAGALVGAGFETPVAALTDSWRRKIAEYLKVLKK